MKQILTILFVLWFVQINLCAQNNTAIDKIFKQLDSLTTKDFDASLQHAHIALQNKQIQADSISYAFVENFIAKAHYFKGNYDSASYCFAKSISTLEAHNDTKRLPYVYNDYAKLYRKLHKYKEALNFYKKSLQIFEQKKDIQGQSMIWNESGVVYEYMNEYDKAIFNYKKSLQLAESINDKTGMAYANSFIANIYIVKKEYKTAHAYIDNAINIFTELKDTFATALTCFDKANIYFESGEYNMADIELEKSLVLAQKLNYPELQKDILLKLCKIAQLQGKDKLALSYLEKHNLIKDSIYTTASRRQIEELNTKYNVQKTELEKQKLQLKLSKKNIAIGTTVGLLLLLALSTFYWKRKKELQLKNTLQLETIKQQDIATKAVIEAEEKERNRIAADLHDGVGQLITAAKFNLNGIADSLNSLNQDDKIIFEKAMLLVEQSGKEIRAVSHNIMPNVLLRSGLGAAIKDFLEKIDNKTLKVNLYTSGLNDKIDSNTEIVLYRVIQESVNNVIKHAQASTLDISLYNEEKGISVTIEDNGKGFDKNKITHTQGIGLKNMETRIKYLKGEIEMESSINKGTFISIFIPKQNLL